MAAYQLKDFQDIYTAILEELKLQSSDTVSLNRIKRMINVMYLDEVIPVARWWWLYGNTTVTHKAYYGTGTANVTPNSTTVTLSLAPSTSVGESGSFAGYFFSVDGTNEIYNISTHTATATTLTLTSAYNGSLNATAGFKIWKEFVVLPTDCRETIEIRHDHLRTPLEGKGLQEYRRLFSEQPKAEARPYYYCTHDFTDPSSGTGETESDRYRTMKVFPAVSQFSTILHIDYIKEASALDAASDEPLMPIEDRIVLFYGALSLAWSSIGRNPEEAARNRALFESKLARMMGKVQDSLDKPRIEPQSIYITSKRGPRISGLSRKGYGNFGGGSSTYTAPTYLENVTINGGTITGNMTVNASVTIDGRDLSVDGASLDAHIAASTNVHGLSGGAAVVGTTSTQTLTNKTIDGGSNTITGLTNSSISVTAAIARSKIASGTASRVVVNDGSGNLADSAITSTELTVLDDMEALTSFTIADNTSLATNVATWAIANFNVVHIDYSIARSTDGWEAGKITLLCDGTNVGFAQGGVASVGTPGVTFTADLNSGNLRLRYTSTNTGNVGTMKYKVNKWLAT